MSFNLVNEFNTTFEVVVRDTGAVRVPEARLRFRLIKEEFGELLDAYEDCDIIELADALGDIEYVTVGAAQVFGLANEVSARYYELLNMFSADDLEENPLLLQNGQKLMLDDLRDSILYNRVEEVVEILASILAINTITAQQFAISLPAVVEAIHKSNMTKLGEDGKPIFREGDRKVMKGPKYTTPTDDINQLVFGEFYAPTSN
jgi:predicted HAD superfamily Cof-like phosphohydrolase